MFIRSWIENGILAVRYLLRQNGSTLNDEFKVKHPDVTVDFLLFDGIV